MNGLDDTFNVASESKQVATIAGNNVVTIPAGEIAENADYDYETTRSNLHALLCQGQEALMHSLELAKQSEHPRAFEVVGNLMKQLADINHQLMDLSEKRQKLKDSTTKDSGTTITNNTAYFVGSTAELNKMLKNIGE